MIIRSAYQLVWPWVVDNDHHWANLTVLITLRGGIFFCEGVTCVFINMGKVSLVISKTKKWHYINGTHDYRRYFWKTRVMWLMGFTMNKKVRDL